MSSYLLPHWLAHFISNFIPNKKCRHHFRDFHDEKCVRKFDENYYVTKYPDVLKSGMTARIHYIMFGRKEGRLASLQEEMEKTAASFDAGYYLDRYPEIRAAGIDPLEHYIFYGKKQGRFPSLQAEMKKFTSFFVLHHLINQMQYLDLSFRKEENPLVSIIIPVYNQIKYTRKCLASIFLFAQDVSFEIIIADDNSTDDTINLSKYVHNITIIRNEANLGFIKNCNNAAKYARGKYIYFLNNDTIVQKGWLSALVNTFETHPDAGVTGSKIMRKDGTLQECGVYIYSDFVMAEIGKDPVRHEYCYLKRADYVSGCSLMTPAWLFTEIGGFDEIFSSAFCDDSDYCFAVQQLGYSVYVQPKSMIYHFGSISYSKSSSNLMSRNNQILRDKWKTFFENKTVFAEYKLPFTNKTRPRTILVINDNYPQFDKHAGGKTIFQFLQTFVSMGLDVKFCPFLFEGREEPYYSLLCQMGIEVIPTKEIFRWIEEYPFLDYILFSRPQVIQNFMTKSLMARGINIFYYGHDVHHLRMQREFEQMGTAVQGSIEEMKNIEITAVSTAATAWYPSEKECMYLRSLAPNAHIEAIPPYLYDTSTLPQHTSFEKSCGLIFVGSSHRPNLSGLQWFVREVLPIIVKSLPDIVLHIVGSGKFRGIDDTNSPNIKLEGYLTEEQLDGLYSTVRLSIAPLLYGAGVKGKIIDALYHQVPVVTTSIGAEGIPATPLISVADDPEDLADHIVRTYQDEVQWSSYQSKYAPFLSDHFSMEKVISIFKKSISTDYRLNERELI